MTLNDKLIIKMLTISTFRNVKAHSCSHRVVRVFGFWESALVSDSWLDSHKHSRVRKLEPAQRRGIIFACLSTRATVCVWVGVCVCVCVCVSLSDPLPFHDSSSSSPSAFLLSLPTSWPLHSSTELNVANCWFGSFFSAASLQKTAAAARLWSEWWWGLIHHRLHLHYL